MAKAATKKKKRQRAPGVVYLRQFGHFLLPYPPLASSSSMASLAVFFVFFVCGPDIAAPPAATARPIIA